MKAYEEAPLLATTDRTQVDQRVLDAVAAVSEELIEFAARVIRVPSVTGDEGSVAAIFADWLLGNGFEVHTPTVDPAFAGHNAAFRGELRLAERPNVFGWWRVAPNNRGPLVLNGHMDVVPTGPRELWRNDPFSGLRENGRIWGRGSADMKGGLVAGLFAIRAARDAGVELATDVQMQCVMGEETTGLGTRSALHTEPRPSAAIVLEPTNCVVVPACGGSVQFTIEVDGKAAHTSVPWVGVNAMENLWHIYLTLRDFAASQQRSKDNSRPNLPHRAPFAVGRFEAGDWRSTIPDRARMSGRMGVFPGQELDEVRTRVLEVVAAACESDPWLKDHSARVTWLDEGFAGWSTPPDSPVVQSLMDAHTVVVGSTSLGGATFASDAGHFAAAGVPTALFGPGRIDEAHVKDEYVEEHQLVLAAQVLALAITRYAGRKRGEAL